MNLSRRYRRNRTCDAPILRRRGEKAVRGTREHNWTQSRPALAGILLEAEKDRDRRTQAAFSCEDTFLPVIPMDSGRLRRPGAKRFFFSGRAVFA